MLLVSGATKTVARISDARLGALLRPGNGNRPGAKPWAIDNGAYAGFDEAAFLRLLEQCQPRAAECLWVAAPDVVGDAQATQALFDVWEPRLRALGFRVAFVAQDAQGLDAPWDRIDCLFVGGTNAYKLSPESRELARRAKARGKLVHVGRVNTLSRLKVLYNIDADSFDGTACSRWPDFQIPKTLRWMDRLDVYRCSQGAFFFSCQEFGQ
jgi:hypothetical protein